MLVSSKLPAVALLAFAFAGSPGGRAQQPATASLPPATFSLEQSPDHISPLDGTWRFHLGDDTRWADPAFDDTSWQLLRSDRTWIAQIGPKSGYGWYRLHVQGLPAGRKLAISLPAIDNGYELFADGQRLGSVHPLGPGELTRQTLPQAFDLPALAPGHSELTLALRVWVNPRAIEFGAGPERAGAILGDAALVHATLQAREEGWALGLAGTLVAICLDTFVGLAMLALFLLRRSERTFLYFAQVLFCQAILSSLTGYLALNTAPLFITITAIEAMVSVTILVTLNFFSRLFEARRNGWFRVCVVLAPLPPITNILWLWGVLPPWSVNIAEALALGGASLWLLLILVRRVVQNDPDARILIAPTAFIFGVHILDPLLSTTFSLGWQHSFESLLPLAPRIGPFRITFSALAEIVLSSSMLVFLLRRFALSRNHEERFTAELDAARSVQQVLVPEVLPPTPGLAISSAYHPAQEVGGDFFQILPLRSGDTLIVIGDVAGKGLPAALTVSLVVGTLRTLADFTESPAAILAGLNRRLHGRGPGFTTCLALRFVSGTNALVVANAGHLPPYRNGHELEIEPNLPLGLDLDAVFAESSFFLDPGDHLALLTDGVPEAMHNHQLLGFDRTGELSRESAADIAAAACGFGQADDITVLTVDILPAPVDTATTLSPVLQTT